MPHQTFLSEANGGLVSAMPAASTGPQDTSAKKTSPHPPLPHNLPPPSPRSFKQRPWQRWHELPTDVGSRRKNKQTNKQSRRMVLVSTFYPDVSFTNVFNWNFCFSFHFDETLYITSNCNQDFFFGHKENVHTWSSISNLPYSPSHVSCFK